MEIDIKYKKIPIEDKNQVEILIKLVTNNLENTEFFIPITEEEFSEFFDENNCILYGAYDKEKLVGMAKLDFLDKYLFELKDIIDLKEYKVAELGRYLVLEEYRNNGIMFELEKIMIEYSEKNNYDYVIATVHPDNIPSNRTIIKAGLKLEKTTTLSNGFYRNIYCLKL